MALQVATGAKAGAERLPQLSLQQETLPEAAAQKSEAEAPKGPTHWFEAFGAIIDTSQELALETLKGYATVLLKQRKQGNPFSATWDTDEGVAQAITELFKRHTHCVQQAKQGHPEEAAPPAVAYPPLGASLLQTPFMLALISQPEISPLKAHQERYVTQVALPATLNYFGAKSLLDIPEYRIWLEGYRIACSKPDTIQPQIDLCEGLTDEQAQNLQQGRERISTAWYRQFVAKEISVTDLHELLSVYSDLRNGSLIAESIPINHPLLLQAYSEYAMLADRVFQNNLEGQKRFWEALHAALSTLLARFNK